MNLFPNIFTQQNSNVNSVNPRDIQNPTIFSAEVVDVILNDSHPDWSKFKRPGTIKYKAYRDYRMPIDNTVMYAIPLDSNNAKPPLIGEFVIIIRSTKGNINGNIKDKRYLTNSSAYYINTISFGKNPTNNNIFDTSTLVIDDSNKTSLENKDFNSELTNKNIFPTKLHEGFITYEGRFGQSLIFGASGLSNPKGVGSILGGKNGDPFTIIRNGNKSTNPNIKSDMSSIYFVSNHRIIMQDETFDSVLGGWTTLNLDNSSIVVTEVHMEDIQSLDTISVDPRAEFTDSSENITPVEISHNSEEGIPVYNQGDPRWGSLKSSSEPYNMRQAGCALCSLAMVTRYLTGAEAITPAMLFNVKNVILVHWSDIITFINNKFGANLTPITFILNPKDMEIADRALESGIPILFESKNKDKLHAGETYKNNVLEFKGSEQKPYVGGKQHWMVITSKNADGTYNLNDPNGGRIRKKQSASDILNKVGRFGFINFKP